MANSNNKSKSEDKKILTTLSTSNNTKSLDSGAASTGKEDLHVSFNLSNVSSSNNSTNGIINGNSRENSFRIVPNQTRFDDGSEVIELADAVKLLTRDDEELMIEESSPENRNSMEWSGSLVEDGEQAELFRELKQDRKERKSQAQWRWWWNMIRETVTVFLPLGLTTFVGGIQIVQKKFVDKKKWLTEAEFMEIYALSQSLPGAIISQVVFSIAMLRHGFWSGFLANLLFCGPGFIANLLFGWLMADISIDDNSPRWILNMQNGLACSGIAFAMSSAIRMASMLNKSKSKAFSFILAGFVAMLTMVFKPMWLLPILIFGGAFVSYVFFLIHDRIMSRIEKYEIRKQVVQKKSDGDEEEDEDTSLTIRQKIIFVYLFFKSFSKKLTVVEPSIQQQENQESQQETQPEMIEETQEQRKPKDKFSKNVRTHSPLWLGISMLLIFALLFVVLIVTSLIFETYKKPTITNGVDVFKETIIMSNFFYKYGTLIFGGGVGGIPLLRNEMVERKWITEQQFMNGFSISNALVGPKHSVAAFYGACIGAKFADALVNSGSNRTINGTYFNETSILFGNDTSSNNATNPTHQNSVKQRSSALYYILPPVLGIIAGILFHLPGYLTMAGCLPLWRKIRENNVIKLSLIGVNAVCVGFVVSNSISMWIDNVGTSDYLAATTIFCFLLNFFDFSPPIIVISGAVLSIVAGEIGFALGW